MARMLLRLGSMRTLIDGQATGKEPPALGLPTAPRYQAGTLLSGKYRLETLLGEGGMGAVWRASNVLLDLPVAIKLIRADLDRGSLRARLQFEARAAAKLGHPAIVRVFDVGESELGDPFIVMEHLRGETLAQLISRGRVPATRVVQLLLPIIDALAMAHSRGIVHRDLKPDNLMIAVEDPHIRPKILDFGIAKLLDSHDSDHKLTEFGAVLGSPEYMSPEQARGREDIDASTDIWSICVVLYEAVTGSPPFSASNCNALFCRIVEDAPKPFSEFALADAELWQIVERGLHKDRAQRYAKIADLGRELAAWLLSQGVTEDASGSALDSKWLGRKSDPTTIAPTVPVDSSPNQEPAPRPAQESHPDSTGIVRGPFTRTILPGGNGRTTTWGIAVSACALLAVSLFALGHSARARAPSAGNRTAAAAAPPLSAQAPAPAAIAPPVASAISKIDVEPGSALHPAPDAKPISVVSRGAKPPPVTLPRVLPAVASAGAASSTAPAASKSERPLDLLAPY